MDIKINKMSIVTTLDKETLFPVADKMHSDMTIGIEGEEMRMVEKMKSSYSNYNKLTEIVVPKEVIDSAISFDEYWSKWKQSLLKQALNKGKKEEPYRFFLFVWMNVCPYKAMATFIA